MASAVSFFPVEETSKLAALMNCEADIQTLLDAQNYDEVYLKFAKNSGALLDAVPPKDLEKVYNLLIAIVSQAKQDDLPDLVPSIINPIVSSSAENAQQKLKVLSNLYNSLESTSHIRYTVFLAIIQLAAQSNELDVLVPTLPQLESFFPVWGVELDESRRMILLLSEVLGNDDEFLNQSYEYLIKYLKTYPQSKSAYPKQVQDTAVKAVKQALRLPAVTNFSDLYALGPVVSLKGTNADLMALVEIFVSGDVKAYRAFTKKHPSFAKDNGFDDAALLKKIRLLTLASTACGVSANDGKSELLFSTVSAALEVDNVDVEEWIVNGIRSGLIDGRINQVNKLVVISRATHRVFGEKQWDLLSDRLSTWGDNLKDLLQVIQNAKQAAANQQQQQQQ
ncbi:hypothetical protein HDU78_006900 [Chytriomyces hyalinus]|nr:hypothetical protein HDU78_006900 [Chytriomyces hyalinus]KAJ3265344.1 hypothetical protein HDU77_005587 [Chytriomyces hyalinus]